MSDRVVNERRPRDGLLLRKDVGIVAEAASARPYVSTDFSRIEIKCQCNHIDFPQAARLWLVEGRRPGTSSCSFL